MSDPNAPMNEPMKWDEANDPDGMTRDDVTPRDWMLQSVLRYFFGADEEHEEASFSASFQVGGQVVSGTVIGRRAWMREQEEALAVSGAETEQLRFFMRTVFDRAVVRAEGARLRRGEAQLPLPATLFFHMKQATVGQGEEAVTFPLWRGRLSDVSGWSFGKVT